MDEMYATAEALVAPGRGILAADESGGTIKKRFDHVGVPSTDENRRTDREMLFTVLWRASTAARGGRFAG